MNKYFQVELIGQKMERKDTTQILLLMKDLARIENYLLDFRVDEQYLSEAVRSKSVEILAARSTATKGIVGILVFYTVPFTYDKNNWLYIKELIVNTEFQSQRVGILLFDRLIETAKSRRVSKIRWDVLEKNHKAKRFYRKMGATHDKHWQLFSFKIK